jgi:hypothetical protein
MLVINAGLDGWMDGSNILCLLFLWLGESGGWGTVHAAYPHGFVWEGAAPGFALPPPHVSTRSDAVRCGMSFVVDTNTWSWPRESLWQR